jgi:hypothetical protein
VNTHGLARRALDLQRAAPAGSLYRRAAGCAAVVLVDARTPAGARKMLRASGLGDEVRDAALDLIDQLTTEETNP